MSSNIRDLKVRFVGDAGNLKRTFQEVGASAHASSAGLQAADASANKVGTSFVKTGKVFRGVGRAFRSSGADAAMAGSALASTIPALSGVSGGAGSALVALDSLSGALVGVEDAGAALAIGVGVVGAAVIAGALAYALLHNDVSAATDAMRAQAGMNAEVAASHRATTDAVYAHKDALSALRGAGLSQAEAALSLERANLRLAELNKQGGKGSLEYRDALLSLEAANQKVTKAATDHGQSSLQHRQALIGVEEATKKVAEAESAGGKATLEYREALLAQKRAQEAVRSGREDNIRQAEEAIRQTQKSSKAISDEVAETKRAADAARQRALGLKLGLISGKDAAGAAKEVKRAIDAEGEAARTAAGKHRDNAQRAREMAAAIRGNSPAARELKARLLELSSTELNTAQWIAALNSAASAAISAAEAIGRANAAAANAGSAPRGGGGGKGGGGGGKGGGARDLFQKGSDEAGGAKFSNEIMARAGFPVGTRRGGSATPLTASAAAEASIAARHRDDSLQDKRVSAAAIAGAGGVTNPDKLAAVGDKAVAESRRAELTADAANVKTAIVRVNSAITKRRRVLRSLRASRRKAKPKAQAAFTEKIRATIDAIRNLFDERRALNADAAELKAEGEELDFDIAGLAATISSLPSVVPPDSVSPTTDTGTVGDTGAGISADAQAQIDQANTNAATARQGAALSDAMSRTLFNSGTIDPGAGFVTVNINTLHPGDPAIQGEVAKWVVGALGGQGSVPTSAYAAGV